MDNATIINVTPLFLSLMLGIFIIPYMRLRTSGKKMSLVTNEEPAADTSGIRICGIAVFPIILVALCLSIALPNLLGLEEMRKDVEPATMRILQIIVGGSLLYIVGLKDDMNGTSGLVKSIVLLLTAAMFPASGLWLEDLQGLFGITHIPAYIGMPLTVIFVMFITEAFVLLDGIDGLSSGVGSIMLVTFFAFSIWKGSTLICFISSAALGVMAIITIMSLFNSKWKRTMLGKSGAYILGYIIAYHAIALSHSQRMPNGMLLICIGTLIVPLFDTIRVLGSRVRDQRLLELPDRNQFNHKLMRTGMKPIFIPITITFLMGGFVLMNSLGIQYHINTNIILGTNLILWILIHLIINWFIFRNEKRHHYENWVKSYGEDVWNANIPVKTLERKVENYGTMGLPEEMVSDHPTAFIPDGMNAFERNTKRMFDFLWSGLCLIVFSPLFALAYILIKLDDGGPAIYKQERIGRFGRPFYIYKYRSMRLDAEKMGPQLSHAGGDDDPRLTRVGKFIRAHHLDELPQLWNVFRGDMAFIGYRPERKFFIDQIMKEDPRYAFLYQIRPGVTSYATLYNGYTDTMEKMLRRLELDLYYLGHRSWWLDFKVLALTFLSIVFGKKF